MFKVLSIENLKPRQELDVEVVDILIINMYLLCKVLSDGFGWGIGINTVKNFHMICEWVSTNLRLTRGIHPTKPRTHFQ